MGIPSVRRLNSNNQPASSSGRSLRHLQAPAIVRELPSTPQQIIQVRNEADSPNHAGPRCRAWHDPVVGRVRVDEVFHIKYVVLSHNTIKGAAGGSLQNAELLLAQGLV